MDDIYHQPAPGRERRLMTKCMKCQKEGHIFSWPKTDFSPGPEEWLCFTCASRKLREILDENQKLKSENEQLESELRSHKAAIESMQAQITDYEKDGPARREKYRADNPPQGEKED